MKSIYYIIILLVITIIFNGCETDENGPMPDTFEEAGVAYVTLDEESSGLINVNDLDAFNLKGSIDVLFDNEFEKLTFVVVYNGDHSKKAVLIDNITTVPYDFSLDIDDIVEAISEVSSVEDIQISDYFTFYVNLTKNGKEYPVYKSIGDKDVRVVAASLVQILQQVEGADALLELRIDVPCGYSVENATGDYLAESEEWGASGDVAIVVDPEDQFVVYVTGLAAMEGLDEDGGPLKMVIDPNSYNVSVERTMLASSLEPWGLSYTGYSFEGYGKLNTCDGTYNMIFSLSVDQGSFGSFAFTLSKK